MNVHSMVSVALRAVLVASVAGGAMLTGCSQTPGGDGPGNTNSNDNGGGPGNDNGNGTGGPPAMQASGRVEGSPGNFLPDDDVWFMITEGGLLSGFGTTTEYVAVFGLDDSPPCYALSPGVTIDFDGQTIDVFSAFEDSAENRTCSFEFSANATPCLPQPGNEAQLACEFSEVSGETRHGGTTVQTTGAGISRYETCDPLAAQIGVLDEFSVTNLHPLSLIFAEDPSAVGAVMVLAGRNGELNDSALLTGFNGSVAVGCGTEAPVSDLRLENGRLTFNIELPGQNDVESCSVRFEGQAVYCASVEPPPGMPGNDSQMLRFEGEGEWNADDTRGDMPVVYLMVGNTDFIRR